MQPPGTGLVSSSPQQVISHVAEQSGGAKSVEMVKRKMEFDSVIDLDVALVLNATGCIYLCTIYYHGTYVGMYGTLHFITLSN